ncbi:MAG TPA: DUF4254 domain-containing protein [Planctomycetes bacterium]|nr:DUF4254 domain-containing protein [Planctomycetota bacterium]
MTTFPKNNKLRPLCERIFQQMERWHEEGKEFFPAPFPSGVPKTLAACLEKLAYHNFHIWHYENYGRSEQDHLVVFGWQGCQENNKERNLTINAIDDLIRPHYRKGVPFHSETLGSLLDRVTIQYLKYLYMRRGNPLLGPQILENILALIDCGQELLDQVFAGKIRCLELPRLKHYFFEERNQGPTSLPEVHEGMDSGT